MFKTISIIFAAGKKPLKLIHVRVHHQQAKQQKSGVSVKDACAESATVCENDIGGTEEYQA